jgi:ribonucleoside-diphosphate reductase alpha chain
VRDLAARGLWDYQMLDDLKYFDGSIQPIERIPDDLKERYLTAFEIDSRWLVECAAAGRSGSIWDSHSTSMSPSQAAGN